MIRVGDEVVVMSFPGVFRVVEVNGKVLTIENDAGIRKRVLVQAVRKRDEKARPPEEGEPPSA
ncbi:MAG: hypothetical protein KatS3mg076_2624 [Candidatus Binatia bacterium]|nr:MAG: hypothetical protein KatS3mg076_2624 [Candidatus Binatia bacterium]